MNNCMNVELQSAFRVPGSAERNGKTASYHYEYDQKLLLAHSLVQLTSRRCKEEMAW